jgi:TRAP-type uncharacterized transport system substrate-binding protein
MRRFTLLAIALVLGAFIFTFQSYAQDADSIAENRTEAELKEQKNAWTIGIAGGLLDTTNMRFADEMGKALNDGDELRILPIVGFGAASNLEDLLFLKGVDAAFTQSDVFEYFRTRRKIGNLQNRVHYVARFPVAELHILARNEFKSIEDLRGKRVSFGPVGTAASMTGTIVFERLGIPIQQVFQEHSTGLQDLASGKLSALVRVAGRPLDFFAKMPATTGFHLLSVPFTDKFADYYTLSELTNEDYPGLVPVGQTVETLGVPTVLAVYNWPKGNPRQKRVARFAQRLFLNWNKLQDDAFHPKWREVNLAATVPGWHRYDVAEDMLKQISAKAGSSQDANRDFQAFLDGEGSSAPKSQKERDALFKEFMAWRAQQGKGQKSN